MGGLSMIANQAFYYIIIFLLPLQLMSADTPLDFVKDTFAIIFVVGLDDLKDLKWLELQRLDMGIGGIHQASPSWVNKLGNGQDVMMDHFAYGRVMGKILGDPFVIDGVKSVRLISPNLGVFTDP